MLRHVTRWAILLPEDKVPCEVPCCGKRGRLFLSSVLFLPGPASLLRDFETKAAASRIIAMAWLKNIEKKRLLSASPVMIAASLHQMAEKYDPQVAPTTLHLPEAVHADFRERVFLYREANVLLALVDRVNPSSDGRDSLFEPVFWEYERIIFRESSDHFGELSDHPILRAAKP